jgi:hypothetical protein
MAFLVVLESMTAAERVAFILQDVFGYPFTEVAEIVGPYASGCRQLGSSKLSPPSPASGLLGCRRRRSLRRANAVARSPRMIGCVRNPV